MDIFIISLSLSFILKHNSAPTKLGSCFSNSLYSPFAKADNSSYLKYILKVSLSTQINFFKKKLRPWILNILFNILICEKLKSKQNLFLINVLHLAVIKKLWNIFI